MSSRNSTYTTEQASKGECYTYINAAKQEKIFWFMKMLDEPPCPQGIESRFKECNSVVEILRFAIKIKVVHSNSKSKKK